MSSVNEGFLCAGSSRAGPWSRLKRLLRYVSGDNSEVPDKNASVSLNVVKRSTESRGELRIRCVGDEFRIVFDRRGI